MECNTARAAPRATPKDPMDQQTNETATDVTIAKAADGRTGNLD